MLAFFIFVNVKPQRYDIESQVKKKKREIDF